MARKVTKVPQPTATSRFPPEIVTHILSHLALEEQPIATLVFQLEDRSAYSQWIERHILSSSSLLAAILIDKLWYSCGVNLLYRRALTVGHDKFALFARTVTKNPALGDLVQCLAVLDVTTPSESPQWSQRLSGIFTRRRYFRDHWTSVVSSCPNLVSVGLSYAWASRSTPNLPALLPDCHSFTKLRIISLTGGLLPLKFIFSTANSPRSFPVTEELSLESFKWDAHFQWPLFPALRALRLSGCSADHGGVTIPATFPELRVVELACNLLTIESIKSLYPYANTLESLVITGNITSDFPSFAFSQFIELKHLVVDSRSIQSPQSHLPDYILALRRLPPNLRTLGIFSPGYAHNMAALVSTQELWRDALLRACQPNSTLPPLRHLYLEGEASVWHTVLPELHDLGSMRNMEIKFVPFCQSPDHFVSDRYANLLIPFK
ncbi:hypothetical protein JAAARDRAFT_192335 [Jaapia argillacea MUCL 33604]|uniref:F-box domain-containing protein n=1 Tax=Jaapia argillacea MUCL 33604 TaxID=933084 RepID=A0A067Q169_9AGAM|nr:hypothetical protein JAAARDRAFT_192335 [Jaapia argillacea MUCL 33604]